MSISVHLAHDKHRHADNSAIHTNFFIQCIHPENRIYRTGKRAITELLDQSISPVDLAAAAHREDREKKKSVMAQLKRQLKAEHKKTTPQKSAESEL